MQTQRDGTSPSKDHVTHQQMAIQYLVRGDCLRVDDFIIYDYIENYLSMPNVFTYMFEYV
jgi:hypothetical protein